MIKLSDYYKVSDDYGNYCIINHYDLALQILKSGANPFNHLENVKIRNYSNERIIDSYEEFCKYFY